MIKNFVFVIISFSKYINYVALHISNKLANSFSLTSANFLNKNSRPFLYTELTKGIAYEVDRMTFYRSRCTPTHPHV